MSNILMKFVLVITIFSCVIVLTGCGQNISNTQNTAWWTLTESGADSMRNRRPDRPVDIQWSVKSLVGNEVTIDAIDTSSHPLLQLSQQEMREKMQSLAANERQKFFQEMQWARDSAKKYEVTVLVPAGIPIAVRNIGNRSAWWFGWGQWGPWLGMRPGWTSANQWLAGIFNATNSWNSNREIRNIAATGSIEHIKVWSSISIRLMTGVEENRKIAERVSIQWSSNQNNILSAGGQWSSSWPQWNDRPPF